MKAMVNKELVLLYRIGEDTPRGKEIAALLQSMRIPAKFIGEEALGETVGALCGLPGYVMGGEEVPRDFQEEMLILLGFSGVRLNQLLALFRETGVRKVELKAAVTPTNREWKLRDLAFEIQKEHQYMKKI